jgi:hypothetical protein
MERRLLSCPLAAIFTDAGGEPVVAHAAASDDAEHDKITLAQ